MSEEMNLNEMQELNPEELEGVSGGKGGSGKKVKATGDVFVRVKADKESGKIGMMSSGDTVPFLGVSKNDSRGVAWFKVKYNGKEGWVSSKYSRIV